MLRVRSWLWLGGVALSVVGCARGDSAASEYSSVFDEVMKDGGLDAGQASYDDPYAGEADAGVSPGSASQGTGPMSVPSAPGAEPADEPAAVEFPPEPALACELLASCYQPRHVGELSGDESGPPVVATGTRSEWLTLRVREDSGLSRGLDVRLRLKAETGANYDLFVYRASDAGGVACSGKAEASAQPGDRPEEVAISWSDRYFGRDDSRTLSVEVRYVDGDCKPWVLDVFRP